MFKEYRSLEFIIGFTITVLIGGLVLFSYILFPDNGNTIDLSNRLLAPFTNMSHIFGTDNLGRDILARLIVGGRISYVVGIVSTLGAVLIGVIIGLYSGFYRGVVDVILMRLVDMQLALPFILLAMIVIAIFGAGTDKIIIIMIVTQWVNYGRLVRANVLSIREQEYVKSAQSYGLSEIKIIFKHILPNTTGPIIVLLTLNIANNILLESSLTFLGLGVINYPSWGGMLVDGRNYMQTAWWIMFFPGMAIMLTILGLNLLGDWLRDFLDPHKGKN